MTKKLIRVSPMLNCLTVQTYYKQTVLVSGPVLPILLIQVKILRYFCCLNVLWALKNRWDSKHRKVQKLRGPNTELKDRNKYWSYCPSMSLILIPALVSILWIFGFIRPPLLSTRIW